MVRWAHLQSVWITWNPWDGGGGGFVRFFRGDYNGSHHLGLAPGGFSSQRAVAPRAVYWRIE